MGDEIQKLKNNYNSIKRNIDELYEFINETNYIGMSTFRLKFGSFKNTFIDYDTSANDMKKYINCYLTGTSSGSGSGSCPSNINDSNNINKLLYDLSFNIQLKEQLEDSTKLFSDTNNYLDDKKSKYLKNKELNKRITEFYSKNTEFKKNLIHYAKILYYILFVCVIAVFFRKKFYKKVFPYIFLIILLLIPNVFVKFLYKKIVNKIGHFSLDFLYIISMSSLIFIIGALFSAVTYLQSKPDVSTDD